MKSALNRAMAFWRFSGAGVCPSSKADRANARHFMQQALAMMSSLSTDETEAASAPSGPAEPMSSNAAGSEQKGASESVAASSKPVDLADLSSAPVVKIADPPAREPLFPIPDLVAARTHASETAADAKAPAPRRLRAAAALSLLRKIDGFQIAGIAVALGVGWMIGATTLDRRADVARLGMEVRALSQRIASAQTRVELSPRAAEVKTIAERETVLRNEVGALKTKLDSANRGAQSRDAEMLASIGRLQKDPRFEQIANRLDRVEHQLSSPSPTASIALGKATPSPLPAAAAHAPAPPPPAPAKSAPARASRADDGKSASAAPPPRSEHERIPSTGYVLRGVRHGLAMLENRDGVQEVAPGDLLPGAGRVERIERRDGGWVVVTSQGVIDQIDY